MGVVATGAVLLVGRRMQGFGTRPFTYFIFSRRLESGFRVVECLTILYIVMTRKMRLSCQNRVTAALIHQDRRVQRTEGEREEKHC